MFKTLASTCVWAALPLAAHDLWLEPTTFAPQPGQLVALRLRVGEDLIGDPVPRDPSLLKQFILSDGTQTQPVAGRAGADPAGLIRLAQPGLHIAGYHSHPSRVEIDAAKFNQYRREEGLEALAPAATAPVRELFARCAKSLILQGAPATAQHDHALGFPLELVAEKSPYALAAGETLPVRLTYQQKPLPGALVIAFNKKNPEEKQRLRAGADGRVAIRVTAPGTWLVKAVHLVKPPAEANADWLSYWASLTFAGR